jgi:hypothetical protein
MWRYIPRQDTLENRVESLIQEIYEIKKELVLKKFKRSDTGSNKINTWKRLGNKISAQWDDVSAVEEISKQREKAC